MTIILLVTTSIAFDEEVRRTLEHLGYEVLCSTQALREGAAPSFQEFLNRVPVVVMSETISTPVMESFLTSPLLQEKRIVRLQSTPKQPDTARASFPNVVTSTGDITDLRDILAAAAPMGRTKRAATHNLMPQHLTELTPLLSKRERTLFQCLWEQDGTFITRQEVAQLLWPDGATNSHLAQLSQLVTKIRLKLASIGVEESIETHWSQGYRLSTHLLTQIQL